MRKWGFLIGRLGELKQFHHLLYFSRKWEWSGTESNSPIGVFEWKTEAI